jgi:hypothetical protein
MATIHVLEKSIVGGFFFQQFFRKVQKPEF